MELYKKLSEQFAIPVLRHEDEETLYQICLALRAGGMKVLEVTVMSDAAYKVIEKLSKFDDLLIGAGTILTMEQAKKASDAGAKFFVSPGLNTSAVKFAQSQNIPFIPGVLTPTEVMAAHALGCEVVKIFPVTSMGGVNYLSALKGPFPKMRYMATGGITKNDLASYKKAGALCVGLGGNLTPKDIIESKNWKALELLAKDHLQAVLKINEI